MLPHAYEEEMRVLLGQDFERYLSALTQPPVRGLHLNRCKGEAGEVTRATAEQLTALSPLPYAADGFLWAGEERVGRHPLHHAGAFYVQEPSAMAPVCCLPDISGCRVLDLCAAPGGKSTQLANRIGPSGLLVANEVVASRCSVLCGNLERMGIRRAIVTHAPAEALADCLPDYFDVVVVDAPCSGEGMFRKDPAAQTEWKPETPAACARRQADILLQAARMLRPGGFLLYATCTFSVCENEGTVAAFLHTHPDFSLCEVPQAVRDVTAPGVQPPQGGLIHPEYCRRFYPHLAAGEGQFMALLRREGDTFFPPLSARAQGQTTAAKQRPTNGRRPDRNRAAQTDAEATCVTAFLREVLQEQALSALPDPVCFRGGYCLPPVPNALLPAPLLPLCYAMGVRIGEVRKRRVIPHHHFFSAFGGMMKTKLPLSASDPRLFAYLSGEEIACDLPDGWGVVTVNGMPLGGIKVSCGRAKNHYPVGLRNTPSTDRG